MIEGFVTTPCIAPQSYSGDRWQSCGSRQSRKSETPATVRRGQAGVTFRGRLPVDRHAGGRIFGD
eukprot:scaffold7743_cov74-Cyclotella_meneghiniana.AAC.2